MEGSIDARHVDLDGRPAVEFTWDGFDDGDHVSGRGFGDQPSASEPNTITNA